MKGGDIVDESEPEASLTLSREGRTTMSQLVKEMSLLCSIYEGNFISLAEEHKLVNREDVGGELMLF